MDHGMKTFQKMNWPIIIAENIIKCKRLVGSELPYVVLISNFIEYFEVRTTDEVQDDTIVRRNCYIKKKYLQKLGMRKAGN